MKNFKSNFLLRGEDYIIVEADEFDKSFLKLSPDFACITSIDPDHLDIYGNEENLKNAFKEFTNQIKKTIYKIQLKDQTKKSNLQNKIKKQN